MKRICVIMIIAACACQAATAQTKRIAHRSHSGGLLALNVNGRDNFGAIPEDWKRRLQAPEKLKPRAADTVKVIKVKPWKQVKDSLPPAVNPFYTKRTAPVSQKTPAKSK